MALTLEETVERAQLALKRSSIGELRRLKAIDEGDAIGLHGQVDTFYHKQLAQELVRNELDEVPILNHVQVSWDR